MASVSISIRNVPSTTRDALARRAARAGMSMQEYLLAELERLATRVEPADLVARIESRVASSGHDISSKRLVEGIRADRAR